MVDTYPPIYLTSKNSDRIYGNLRETIFDFKFKKVMITDKWPYVKAIPRLLNWIITS